MGAKKFWPLGNGRIVTSPFGQRAGGFHTGTDFGAPGGSAGMRVYAVQSGTVIYCGAAQGYGGPDPAGWVVIDSDDSQGGGVWEYGHIVRLDSIKPGSFVQAGQQIGIINPDSSTNGGVDPHLHVSFMPGSYKPDQKISPMGQLRGALEPEETLIKDPRVPSVPKPGYNEYWVASPSFSGRNGTKIDLVLLHTQEGGGGNAAADSLARYLANPANNVSYHYTISQASDGGVTVCDIVDTKEASWSVLSANSRSINLCFAGSSASWTREQWMKQSKAIEVAAYLAVQDCVKYGIPIKVLSPPYTSPPPGISDHAYVTKYLKDGTHTDCGAGFPWDFFAQCVFKYAPVSPSQPLTPQPAQKPPTPPAPPAFRYPSHDEMVLQIWEQLFGPQGKGWPQLGGKTLVDAVAELQSRLKK